MDCLDCGFSRRLIQYSQCPVQPRVKTPTTSGLAETIATGQVEAELSVLEPSRNEARHSKTLQCPHLPISLINFDNISVLSRASPRFR